MHKKVLSGIVMSYVVACSILSAGGDFVTPSEPVLEIPESSAEGITSGLYNVGIKVGTLGIGIDVSRAINEDFALRVNVNGAAYERSGTQEDIDYTTDITFANAGLLGDYYPFESVGFRLSAGVYYNANKAEAQGQPTAGTFTINDVDYQASEIGSLNGNVDFEKFAPYLGLGWGNDPRSEGWGFSLDIGALIGNPTVDLVATRGIVDDATWADIQADVQNEENTLNSDLNDLGIYPVLMVGITYTF